MPSQSPPKRRPATPLKLAIVAEGWTVNDLATVVGTTASQVSRHANGLLPPAEKRAAYAKALKRTEEELGW